MPMRRGRSSQQWRDERFGATPFDTGGIVEYLTGREAAHGARGPTSGFASAAMRSTPTTSRSPFPSDRPQAAAPRPTQWIVDVPAEPRIAETLAAQVHYILDQSRWPIDSARLALVRTLVDSRGSLTSVALLRLGIGTRCGSSSSGMRSTSHHGYVPCCVSPAGADPWRRTTATVNSSISSPSITGIPATGPCRSDVADRGEWSTTSTGCGITQNGA